MTEKIKKQILDIRATGETNMFDVTKVRDIAILMGFTELFAYLRDNKTAYANFILTGEDK